MAFSLSNRTQELLFQSFLIVLSVLLALFLDEARNDYKLGRQRDAILGNVLAELRANAASLDEVHRYHGETSRRIGAFLDSLDGRPIDPPIPAVRLIGQLIDGSIREPALQQTAWETARLSPAFGLIPYDTIYPLTYLYDVQAKGAETTWQLIATQFFEHPIYDAAMTERTLLMLSFTFNELQSQERSLLAHIHDVIERVCETHDLPECEESAD